MRAHTVAMIALLASAVAVPASSPAAIAPTPTTSSCKTGQIQPVKPAQTTGKFRFDLAGSLPRYCIGQVGGVIWELVNRSSAPAKFNLLVAGPDDLLGPPAAAQPPTITRTMAGGKTADVVFTTKTTKHVTLLTVPSITVPAGRIVFVGISFVPQYEDNLISASATVNQTGAKVTLHRVDAVFEAHAT